MKPRVILVVAVLCAVFAGVPGLAAAASGTASQAITDCNDHGKLTQQYSSATLRTALAQMPADVREYTDCFDVITRQLFAQQGSAGAGGGTTTGSSSGSSFLPTWLIVVIVVLALAAITFGALAIRRRGGGPGGPGGPGDAGGPGPGAPGGPGSPGGPESPGDPGPGAGGAGAPPAT